MSDRSLEAVASPAFLDRSVLSCPYAYYQRSQAEAPVIWVPELGVYLVTRHRDVLEVLADEEVFASGLEGRMVAALRRNPLRGAVRKVLAEGYPQVETLPWLDPPGHIRQRAIVMEGLQPRRVARLREPIRRIAEQLIATWPDHGDLEFVDAFAAPLPIAVLAEAFGIERKDRRRFRLWCDGLVRRLGHVPTSQQEVAEAMKGVQFQRLVGSIIEARRDHPRDDMLSDLVHAPTPEGAPVTTTELVNLLLVFVLAGTITTQSLLTSLLYELVRQPELARQLRADPDLRLRALEETARLHSPVKLFTRVTTREVKLGGVMIPAGEMVLPVFHAANVDDAAWADPLTFRLDRPVPGDHLSFGFGTHACAGAELARTEVLVALDVILENFSAIELRAAHEPQFEPNVWLSVMRQLWLSVSR